jgi:sterol desaturase/sphingolipid hydroxylase (fatty acid hydroxylase superfamily)
MRHHFQDHRYGFGVSSPLWDAIMGTLPRNRKAAGDTASPSDRGHEREADSAATNTAAGSGRAG